MGAVEIQEIGVAQNQSNLLDGTTGEEFTRIVCSLADGNSAFGRIMGAG
jgi:hypothetical protein